MRVRPVGADLLPADGQTDGEKERLDEVNTHFSRFCETRLKITVLTLAYSCAGS